MVSLFKERQRKCEENTETCNKTYSRIERYDLYRKIKKLILPSLAHRRRRGDMIQTFKIIKCIEDIPFERFLNCVPHHRPVVIVSNWRNPDVEQHSDYSSFHREL